MTLRFICVMFALFILAAMAGSPGLGIIFAIGGGIYCAQKEIKK